MKPMFNIGNRIIHSIYGNGTILSVINENIIGVEWDQENTLFHNGRPVYEGLRNHCYNVDKNLVTLIKSTKRKEVFKPMKKSKLIIPERKEAKIPYNEFKLGIELETLVPYDNEDYIQEKISNRSKSLPFKMDGDGSIETENGCNGVEFKGKGPMSYDELKKAVKNLTEQFQEYDVNVNQSCGFHLHVSHKKFFVSSQVNKIIMAWSAIEDVFLATQPKSRTNNSYCKRYLQRFIADTKNERKLIRGKEKLINQLGGIDRYFTLNLSALARHGTIEIRMHAGTTNYTKIMAWIDLMLAFFTYCLKNYDSKEIFGLFNQSISDQKVSNVFNVLGLSNKNKEYFTTRIQKFLYKYLAKQQESAGKIMKNLDAVKKARKEYMKSQDKYNRIQGAFQQEYSTIQEQI